MNEFFVGLDLGSINDFTAIAVVERHGEMGGSEDARGPWHPGRMTGRQWIFREFRLWHLERHLGEPYTKIISHVQRVLDRPELENAHIIADATGVGRAVIDLMKERGLTRLVPVTITGGDAVTSEVVNGLKEYRTPKRDLVGVLQVLLQNRELRIPASLDLKDELVQELQNFRVKLAADTGHATYEHWRSGDHDDLVLAVALGVWFPHVFRPAPTVGYRSFYDD